MSTSEYDSSIDSVQFIPTLSVLRVMLSGLLAISLMLGVSGCAALLVGAGGAAGAAGVAWAKGDLEATLQADPRAIEQASIKAFEVLSIPLVSSSSTAFDGEVIGRTATDTRIVIGISAKDEGRSDISIRVGTFGDQQRSLRILEEIRKQLDPGAA